MHDNDKSYDQHLLPGDETIGWKDVLGKLKEYGYTGPIALELCYRHFYLEITLEAFYREVMDRGMMLRDIEQNVIDKQ